MENKQLFTKVAVSVLIGLNVGAYYVFWPHQDGGAKPATKKPDEDKGQTKLLPTKPEPPTSKPAELPSLTSVPLSIPNPKKAEFSPDEAVNKLLDHINRDKVSQKDLPPPIPMFPEDAPKVPSEKNVGVTSPLVPKVPEPSIRWTVTPKGGGRHAVSVTAKLSDPESEFWLQCDKITTEPGSGDIVANGDVRMDGLGVFVRCERLTLAHGPSRIIFEGDVSVAIVNAPANNHMQSARVVWELRPRGPTIAPIQRPLLGPPK